MHASRRAMVVLLGLTACHDFPADLETCAAIGKCVTSCSSDTDCSNGTSCNRAVGRCETTMTACAWPAFPSVPACGNDRDVYLAPDGADANPGTSERPRKTLSGLSLLPGDRIHLGPGTYSSLVLEGDGTTSCPITLDGALDGGALVRLMPGELLRVNGSSWRVSNLRVEGGGSANEAPVAITRSNGGRLEDVRLRRVDVHLVADAQAHVLIERCTGCVVEGSTFTKEPAATVSTGIQLWTSPEAVVQGNRFVAPIVLSAVATRSGTSNMKVIGNVFRGSSAAQFDATGAVFARNLVADVSGGTMVVGATEVLHNTFLRLGNGVAARGGRFSGNLVSLAGTGRFAIEGGGYNLFNAVKPSADGGVDATDLVTLPKVDAEGVLLDGSPAIDAADPTDAVPPGGGSRADIGAFERGAVRLDDGRYCLAPDAGW